MRLTKQGQAKHLATYKTALSKHLLEKGLTIPEAARLCKIKYSTMLSLVSGDRRTPLRKTARKLEAIGFKV